jgi:hypothetical protein
VDHEWNAISTSRHGRTGWNVVREESLMGI